MLTEQPVSCQPCSLLQLLLWADVIGVTTLLLATVRRSLVETSITLSTDHLVTVVFLGQDAQGGLNDTSSKTKDKVKSRLCNPAKICVI